MSAIATRTPERPPAGSRPVARRPRRRLSPLTLRILAVNVLALAMLLGGLLYLGRYQDRLIQAEMHALRTEGRIFASALGEGAVDLNEEDDAGDELYALEPELARQMVRRLVEATETRTRVFDTAGHVLSDSRVLTGSFGNIQIEELPPPPSGGAVARAMKAVYAYLADILPSREKFPVYQDRPSADWAATPDVRRALTGETAQTVWRAERRSGRPGLVITVAVPVQRYKQVLGAVLLSRSGAGIDDAIRSVRLDILKVFVVALAVTVLLSVYLAGTIARPIRRLAGAADRLRLGHGRHSEIPDFTGRGDEIGDLSGVLRAMTAAQWARMDAIERFAADVAHEIKNPLSSLRSAVETVERVHDPERRARLMAIISDDVQRLDRLISDISNASRLDAELSRAEVEPVDLGALLRTLAEVHRDARSPDGADIALDLPEDTDLTVLGLEGRLTQVFQNLIINALSFSPADGIVRIHAAAQQDWIEVAVCDDGPGIPDGKEEAIFERFYTERPQGEKFGTHSGLGLSISKQIVEAHGGRITAANRHGAHGEVAGARFAVQLPRN